MYLKSPEPLPFKTHQHFFAHVTETLSTVQAVKAYKWRYNSTHSSLWQWRWVVRFAARPIYRHNSNVMLFYICNGTRHFEGPKQKTFQEQLIKPVLRNVPSVTDVTKRPSKHRGHRHHSKTQRSGHTLYLFVLCGSQNKQRLFPYTALTDWFL